MCLGIPMQIVSIDGYEALCEAKSVQRRVNLFLLQNQTIACGDFVLVHVGYAIQKVSPQDAHTAWELYDQMLVTDEAT
jgi:hydrogenase expression/formation protein HypC